MSQEDRTVTMTTPRPAIRPAARTRATALAAELLKAHRLGSRLEAASAAIGRALAENAPKSDHGQLLFRALAPGDRRTRPADERAVLALAERGETPTAAAVTAWLEADARRTAAARAIRTAAAIPVAEHGRQAAAYVAETLERTGTGPTWPELADALGWPARPRNARYAIITKLITAGWLEAGEQPRSLRPGRKHTGTEGRR